MNFFILRTPTHTVETVAQPYTGYTHVKVDKKYVIEMNNKKIGGPPNGPARGPVVSLAATAVSIHNIHRCRPR